MYESRTSYVRVVYELCTSCVRVVYELCTSCTNMLEHVLEGRLNTPIDVNADVDVLLYTHQEMPIC